MFHWRKRSFKSIQNFFKVRVKRQWRENKISARSSTFHMSLLVKIPAEIWVLKTPRHCLFTRTLPWCTDILHYTEHYPALKRALFYTGGAFPRGNLPRPTLKTISTAFGRDFPSHMIHWFRWTMTPDRSQKSRPKENGIDSVLKEQKCKLTC